MGRRSIVYNYPWIFDKGSRLFHGKHLDARFKHISRVIGKNKTVLEPGCGTGFLAPFLDKSCIYSGFDPNEKFVRYAIKNGLEVKKGNALNPADYFPADVIVLSDLIHHVGRDEKKVLRNCLKFAKEKIIICEPHNDDFFGMLWKLPFLRSILVKSFNYVEMDGNNRARFENSRTKKELENVMRKGFGVIPTKFKRTINNSIKQQIIITYSVRA